MSRQAHVSGTLVNVSCDKIPEPLDATTPADPMGGVSDTVVGPAGKLMWNPAKWPIGMRCGMELPSQGDGLRRVITGLPPMRIEDPPGSPPRTEQDNAVNQSALELIARAMIELAREQMENGTPLAGDLDVSEPPAPPPRAPVSQRRATPAYCAGSDAPPAAGSIRGQKMGVCPVCGQRLNLRVDGNLRKHRRGVSRD